MFGSSTISGAGQLAQRFEPVCVARPPPFFAAAMGKQMKRPAACTLNESIHALEDAADNASKRSKGKGEKWAKLKARGALPAHIEEYYNNVPDGVNPREHRTDVINRLFTQTKDGKYIMNTNDVMFKQSLAVYNKKYSRDEEIGVAKTVFIAKHFHGDEKAFDRAVEKGDVHCKEHNGKEFYAFQQVIMGSEGGYKEEHQMDNTKKLSRKEAMQLESMMTQLKWTWKKAMSDDAIMDGEISDPMKKLLRDALNSQNKLAAEGLKMLKNDGKVFAVEDSKQIRQTVQACQQLALALQHLIDLGILPKEEKLTQASLENFLKETASTTQQSNELIESMKGKVRASKN